MAIVVGEYVEVGGNIEVAEVTGSTIERACGIMATRPPYRDGQEAARLSEEDYEEASDLVIMAANLGKITGEVEELDRSLEEVIFTRNGAFAVRGYLGVGFEAEFADVVQAVHGDAIFFRPMNYC